MKIFSPVLKGTTTVSDGTTNLSGSFTGSLQGTAATASYVVSSVTDATQNTRLQTLESVTGSYASTSSLSTSNSRISVLENVTGSYASTGSNSFNGSQTITGSLTATGTIVAQTLVVQTITSSVDFVTGSAKFGSTTGNTHQFTGSLLVSGSSAFTGSITANGEIKSKVSTNYGGFVADNGNTATIGGGFYSIQSFGSARGLFAVAGAISGTTDNNVGIFAEGGSGMGAIKYYVGGSGIASHIMTADGNVGIGTTNPSVKLHIKGNAESKILDVDSDGFDGRYALLPGRFVVGTLANGYPQIGYNFAMTNGVYSKIGNDTAWGIDFGNNNQMKFQYAATGTGNFSWNNAMIINASGNIGIKTTSPLQNFHVYADNGSGIGIGRNLTNDNFSANLFFYPSSISSDKRNWAITTYFTSAGLLEFRRSSTTTADPYDSGVTVMALDGVNDRVGIGTTTPAKLLTLYSSVGNIDTGAVIRLIGNTANDLVDISVADTKTRIYHQENSADADAGYGIIQLRTNAAPNPSFRTRGGFQFTVGSTDVITISNTFTVGIGVAPDASRLNIQGPANEWALSVSANTTTSQAYGAIVRGGTNSNDVAFRVNNAANNTTYLTVNGDGKVMIGTASNLSTGAGTQSMVIRNGTSGQGLYFASVLNAADQYVPIGTQYDTANGNNRAEMRFAIDGSDTNTRISFHTAAGGGTLNERMRVTSNGRVGIRTTSPTHTLHVEGDLRVNRTVYSWYKGSWQGNGTYWHMKTNLYAGAAGNTQYTMSLFKAYMYSYSSAAVYEGAYGFHNWSGILYSAASAGNIGFGGYISTDGYVVLVITSGSGETGVTIDWHQTYADYPFRDSSVTAAGLHGSTTGKY